MAAYQEVTCEWWRDAVERFDLLVSELVLAEAGAGDPVVARDRLKALQGVALLNASPDGEPGTPACCIRSRSARSCGRIRAHRHRRDQRRGVSGDVNFRHIANAAMRVRIERACRRAGYQPPVIRTPNELMETGHGDDTG